MNPAIMERQKSFITITIINEDHFGFRQCFAKIKEKKFAQLGIEGRVNSWWLAVNVVGRKSRTFD
jgi:hypothetical protein